VQPWQDIATAHAPDATLLELRRRGDEFLIRAGGYDLMSSEDASSSRALAEFGCAHMTTSEAGRVLIGGLGMGFTLAAALASTPASARIDVAELVDAVAEWNREWLADLAGHPLDDPRTTLLMDDVGSVIEKARGHYDAILLDVDNGPDSLAHDTNEKLYDRGGIEAARRALRAGGVLAVWSFSEDPGYTRRLRTADFDVQVERVLGSKKGRGRRHYIWLATKAHG
jgi:spermidine synthase